MRLLREAQALAKLNHPNIVTVHDVGEHEGSVWLAMEFVDGVTLSAWLAERRRSWREVLEIAKDRDLHRGVRKNALFWIGQEAADAALSGLTDVATDESEDQDVRNSAVFALSQRDDDEAIPVLIEIAETAEHPETRKSDDVRRLPTLGRRT